MRTIVWFRGKDLRVGDHEPLARAAAEGEVIPLFVLEPRFFGPGRARRAPHRMQFLLESLAGLQEGLSQRGSGLVLLEGPSTSALPRVAAQWKVDRVWAHRGSEPGGRARDDEVARALDVPLRLFEGETLTPPGSIRTRTGRPYSVFTPFKRAYLEGGLLDRARPAPESLPPLPSGIGLKAGIDYRLGEAHYVKYLVDGDPAQNNLGWQWSAGCGCDAQPWFRVFNPVLQGDRFDPSGGYVRRWLPRLDLLPNRYIHRPWEAPARVLERAGIRLGQDYPYPVVDHSRARDRFLQVARNTLRGRVEDAGG